MKRLLIALIFLLAACAATQFDVEPDQPTFVEALGLADRAPLKAASLRGRRRAHVAVRHMPHLASVAGGLPIVSSIARPVAGVPFTIAWTTRPTPAYPDGPQGPRSLPSSRVALFVSKTPPVRASPLPGGRGGMLQVPPEHVFEPALGSFLTQEDGVVALDVTFPSHLVGLRLWMQLVVEDSRVPIRVVTTPMVEIVVGEA